MKILEIRDNQGFFNAGDSEKLIDSISKDELLKLVDHVLGDDAVELDEYRDDLIGNPAQKIIYKNIYKELSGLLERRSDFVDVSKKLYSEAYEKYKLQ